MAMPFTYCASTGHRVFSAPVCTPQSAASPFERIFCNCSCSSVMPTPEPMLTEYCEDHVCVVCPPCACVVHPIRTETWAGTAFRSPGATSDPQKYVCGALGALPLVWKQKVAHKNVSAGGLGPHLAVRVRLSLPRSLFLQLRCYPSAPAPGLCLKGRGGHRGRPRAVAELSQGM